MIVMIKIVTIYAITKSMVNAPSIECIIDLAFRLSHVRINSIGTSKSGITEPILKPKKLNLFGLNTNKGHTNTK